MSMRWISFLFVTLFICADLAHAQDAPASPVPDATVEQQPAAADLTAPAADAPAAVQETEAAPGDPESTTTGVAPAADEPSTAATAVVPATGPVASVDQDDRVRSVFILVSAVVLISTLIAIIIILLKRSRESRQEQRRYVAEAFLRDVSGSTNQGMYKLGIKPVMLGRVGGKDTEFLDYIVIPSATIGRRHALIEFKDFGYWVMDQGSINGTFVNDRPVSSEVRLKHGDRLRLHKLEFEFVMPELGESGVTVVAPDGFRAAGEPAVAAAAAVASDFVLEPEPDTEGDELDKLRESVESEEATLLPVSSSLATPADGSSEETLLPASGGEGAADETLLPASGGAERGKAKPSRNGNDKNGDEVFDITGGD